MTWGSARLPVILCCLELTLLGPLAPRSALAQLSAGHTPGQSHDEAKLRALQHFERARELYRDGNYRDALTELEAAQELDPDAKDLVFNLSTVSEKLGRIDDALRWMRAYRTMDLDPQEATRAESSIRRLEGAKRTLETEKPADAPAERTHEPASPAMGRVDALTIGAGAVTIAGLGVGTVFGIDALSSRPESGFVTGVHGSYADLAERVDSAHGKAVVADVGFVIFVAGAVATGLLYFLRPKATSAPATATWRAAPQARGAPIAAPAGSAESAARAWRTVEGAP